MAILTRRAFLLTTAAASACRAAKPKAAPTAFAPAPTASPEIPTFPTQTIVEAERLAGIHCTPAEREQMARHIGALVQLGSLRRGHALDDGLAPATTFSVGAPPARARGGMARSRGSAPPLPADSEAIAYAPVATLARWIERRVLTSTRLTEIYLDRLSRIAPSLECVITPTPALARAQAAAADREIAAGRYRGPLHGIPWGAKDLLDTAGIPTTYGAGPYRSRVPTVDAVCVQRLHAAGAVLLGKLTLGELAYGDIWFGGQTRNPWNLEEGSSGSSAGPAAATAAGLCGFAIGSETMGSIISPSMRCGATGLRPTFGRVARTGAMALSWSLDKLGAITRSSEDAALVLAAISGADAGDPSSVDAPLDFNPARPIRGLRVGYDPAWFAGEHANLVDRAALEAARRAGLALVEIALPKLPYEALHVILLAESAAAFEQLALSGRLHELREQHVEAWPNTMREARFISAVDLVQAERLRREAMRAMAELYERVDLLIGPSFADPIFAVTNFTGHPSLTIRAGFVESPARGFGSDPEARARARRTSKPKTVPHGITLWGRLWDEGTLCRVGMALDGELGASGRRPPLQA
jgi:Asp-tRNA(Asn)/Glu-tRNA(Gln) amidotransferase A subunit family amidase